VGQFESRFRYAAILPAVIPDQVRDDERKEGGVCLWLRTGIAFKLTRYQSPDDPENAESTGKRSMIRLN
jgi:hypothetical protein